MPVVPIDPAISSPIALAGRVVTMDAVGTVLAAGVVYAQDGSITAVLPDGVAPPAGFETVPLTQSGGTIYPGLIELHNHLPYDVLSLWNVPKQYGDRDQWSASSTPDYHRLITGPMSVLGRNDEVVPAIVRYVELRCLLGGTTTSQGVVAGVRRRHRQALPRPRPQRRVDRRSGPSSCRNAHRRRGRERCGAFPGPHLRASEDHPAPGGGDGRGCPAPLPSPAVRTGQVGDHPEPGGHPLRRPHRRGLRGVRRSRRQHGLVAVLQPAAVREDGRTRRRAGSWRAGGARVRLVAVGKQEPARRAQGCPAGRRGGRGDL